MSSRLNFHVAHYAYMWYATSFGILDDTEPMEMPPILENLSADCLGHVLSYLDLISISALRLIGNTVLWQRILSTCRELRSDVRNKEWMHFQPAINFPALKFACSGFAHLNTLVIHQHNCTYSDADLLIISQLPRTLRNLTLELCVESPKPFLAHNYAHLFPVLHTLRLASFHRLTYEDREADRDDWARNLPKSLTYLGLQHLLYDEVAYVRYICGLGPTGRPSADAPDASRAYPYPNLKYLDLEIRTEILPIGILPAPVVMSTGTPVLSQFPPTLEYLRLFKTTASSYLAHCPPSFDFHFNEINPSTNASSTPQQALSVATETSSPATRRLKYVSIAVPLKLDIFPSQHLRMLEDSFDYNLLPSTLVSLSLYNAILNISDGARLPPTLRYLEFNAFHGPQFWAPDTLPHLTSLSILSAVFYPTGLLSALPATLTRLMLQSTKFQTAEELALLPPSLTMLSILCENTDPVKSSTLPRALKYLFLEDCTRVQKVPKEPLDFAGIFGHLPPGLLELTVASSFGAPLSSLGLLPRSLRHLHLSRIELPATPAKLKGIPAKFSAWVRRNWNGSDPKAGHRNSDWLDNCLALLPPGCLCQATLVRDGEEIRNTSASTVPHVLIRGQMPMFFSDVSQLP